MNQRLINLIVVAFIAIPLALVMGQWAATDKTSAVTIGVATVAATIVLLFGKNIWLLIPFFLPFTAALRVVPGGLSLRDVVVGFVVAIMFGHVATRRVRLRFSFGTVEMVLLVIVVFIVEAFVRNPVGVAAMGSSLVGGRPYFEMAVSVACFLMLSTLQVPTRLVKTAAGMSIAGGLASAIVTTITFAIPVVGTYIARVYAVVGTGVFGVQEQSGSGGALKRLHYMRDFVAPATTGLLAGYPPPQLLSLRNPLILLATLATILAALLSGYRASVLWMALMVAMACLVRRRTQDLLIMVIAGSLLVGVLVLGQGNVFKLPLVTQRALSFLPGAWDSKVKQNAAASTEWRLDMWKLVLTTDRYISNKILGDGFGLSRHEYLSQLAMWQTGRVTDSAEQDFYMRSGGYHSGPIESIRRVGYVGAAFLILCQIAMARFAWRALNATRGTPQFFAAMVFGLPLIVHPFDFVFIFGTFKDSVSLICLNGGFLRMLLNGMSAAVEEESATSVSPSSQSLPGAFPAGRPAV